MESAKTQKLSLNEADESGFQGYSLEPLTIAQSEARPFRLLEGGKATPSFGLPETFWEWVKHDPEVSHQMQVHIDAQVEAEIAKRSHIAFEAARQKGEAEGVRLGREEAKREVDAQLTHLTEVVTAILKEKQKILFDHEDIWIAALGHLLKRFLVSGRELALAEIDKWLKEGLVNFEKTGKIRLHLSENDHRKLESILHQLPKANWELVRDLGLKDGEVHCETSAGGIYFSTDEELSRLFAVIDRYSQGVKSE